MLLNLLNLNTVLVVLIIILQCPCVCLTLKLMLNQNRFGDFDVKFSVMIFDIFWDVNLVPAICLFPRLAVSSTCFMSFVLSCRSKDCLSDVKFVIFCIIRIGITDLSFQKFEIILQIRSESDKELRNFYILIQQRT